LHEDSSSFAFVFAGLDDGLQEDIPYSFPKTHVLN